MKFFSNIHAKRNIALLVLLAWLFALASGIANACLLETRQTHSHIGTDSSFEAAAQAPVILPGHTVTIADGIGEQLSKASCLKVCDDGTRSFPKQDGAGVQTDVGLVPFVLIVWVKAAPIAPMMRQFNAQQATPELPIRVRFSRLVI